MYLKEPDIDPEGLAVEPIRLLHSCILHHT
jgi:hypothetical protein